MSIPLWRKSDRIEVVHANLSNVAHNEESYALNPTIFIVTTQNTLWSSIYFFLNLTKN